MASRIPGIAHEWQQYFLCLLFHLLFPLSPLVVEYSLTKTVSDQTACLTGALYALSIGMSSRSLLSCGIGIGINAALLVGYGISVHFSNLIPPQPPVFVLAITPMTAAAPLGTLSYWALWSIVIVFVFHALERYNRHVVDKKPFWDFDTTRPAQ